MMTKFTPDQIKIDPEFRDLLCPLSEYEERALEGSLLADGCLSPLIVEEKLGVLIDGHNRLRLCKAHGIPYEVKTLMLGGRESAERWIISNQLGRRNLTPERLEAYIAQIYRHAKKKAGFEEGNPGDKKHWKDARGQNDPVGKSHETAKKVGEQFGKSEKTVRRIAKKIEAIEQTGKLDEYQDGKLPKQEVKQILEAAKPVRKQSKAEADEEAEVIRENPEIFKPKIKQSKPTKIRYQQSNGLGIAATAISVLGKIHDEDTQRVEGLEVVISYCIDRLGDKEKVNSIIAAIAKSKLTNTERADLVSRIIGEMKPPQNKVA